MSRLVSYGPDEDLTEESQSEEEEEEVAQEVGCAQLYEWFRYSHTQNYTDSSFINNDTW